VGKTIEFVCHRRIPLSARIDNPLLILDGWRIHEITWRQASDTTLDSASASRTKKILSMKPVPQLSVRAAVLPTRHVFDIHYKNVGNQVASPPDRPK
jgi:hypothetical protein